MSTTELALIYNFQSFQLCFFSAPFLSRGSSSVNSPYIDKRWHPPSYQTCTAAHTFPFRHTVFFDQSLEEWINKKSIRGCDVLLPVAFKGHRPSTNHNSIVQLRESAFRVGICYWSRHHSTRRARQSSLSSCSRVYPIQSHPPNSEWQCSSVPVVLLSLTCQLEWDSDHPPLTNWLFHLTTSLLSASGSFQSPPPISGTVSLHISHQHRRWRFSGSVLRLFSSGAPILT